MSSQEYNGGEFAAEVLKKKGSGTSLACPEDIFTP